MAQSAGSPYYHGANPDLLRWIPVTARHVLELGCGAGALAGRFRLRSPGVVWSGIEIVADVAEMARRTLDSVLCADIEALPDLRLDSFLAGKPPPDVLVLGDVLEHLRDPQSVLDRLVSRLAPGAVVVACIPNVGHWSIIADLLRGRWTYEDEGLLDRTHLRFFTLHSAVGLFSEARLMHVQAASRNVRLDPAGEATFVAAIAPAIEALGLDEPQARVRMAAYQYVLRAVKPPSDPPLHVHHVIMVPGLCDARVLTPIEALGGLPEVHVTHSVKSLELPELPPEMPKILVLQRQLVVNRAAWLAAAARVVQKGWLIVAEWDDHPSLLPSPALEKWQLNPWLPFSGVHAVQVSTPLLADALRDHNPEIAVLPNALLDLPPPAVRGAGDIRIVCAAVARPGIAALIAPALDAAAADPRVSIEIVNHPEVFEALQTRRKTHHRLLPYGAYLDLLGRSDISLMPILGLPPERYKSPLKFIESASRGAACIASPVLYDGVVEHGTNGLLADSPEQWTEALLRLVRDGDFRNRLALEGWRSVRDRHLQAQHVGARLQWYRSLWARRHALRTALAQRHPEFGTPTEV